MGVGHDTAPPERLLALRARPPEADAKLAEAVARDVYGLTARATSLEGERDRNFLLDTTDGQRFVLKFIDHEADDVIVAGQSAVLMHLAAQEAQLALPTQEPTLAVPHVVRTRDGADVGMWPTLPTVRTDVRTADRDAPAAGASVRTADRDAPAAGASVRAADRDAPTAGASVRAADRDAPAAGADVRTAHRDAPAAGADVRAAHRGVPSAGPDPRAAPANCRVRLATYLPGRLIQDGSRRPASDALLRSVGTQIAHLDRALRGFFHPALGQPLVWDVRRAPALLSVLPRVRSQTCRRLVADAVEPITPLLPKLNALRSQAIHGDCHGRNLLADDDGNTCVGIIDLGDLIHAPLVLEIAVTMGELFVDGVAPLDKLPQLLAAYTEVQPLERADFDVLYELISARIALDVLIQTWRGSAGESEETCASALDALATQGKTRLTNQWIGGGLRTGNLLKRRHAALGANAELSYDRPLHLVRGDGVWVYTSDGERLLDVYNNVPHVGHAHPAVVEAIARQVSRIASNTRYLDERIIEYIEHLTATLPSDLDTCLFVNSGSEANDIAWRIAKAHTGQGGALVMKYAYHGITEAVTALSPSIATTVAAHIEQLAAPTLAAPTLAAPTLAAPTLAAPTLAAPTLAAPTLAAPTLAAPTLAAPAPARATPADARQTPAQAGPIGAGARIDRALADTPAANIALPTDVAAIDARAALAAANVGAALADAAAADVRAALRRLRERGLNLAALMIDSGLTSTGIYDPPAAWVAPIVAAVREAGALIIGDEVQYGLGRSGSDFWGFARRGYHPDIVTLGKPVGNGYPLGVVITRRAILEKFQRDTGFFSTFGGNPVAGAAGLAVLDVLARERLVDNARTTGDYFIARLREVGNKYECIKDVRGHGLLIGVEVTDKALTKQLVNGLRDRGVLIGSEGPNGNVLKLRPPMPFRPEHADIVVNALTEALSAVRP